MSDLIPQAAMGTSEAMKRRLKATETTLQVMFCTGIAELIIFEAAIAALREERILADKLLDRMVIDARTRLQLSDPRVFSPQMVVEIIAYLNGLAEQLRGAAPSASCVDPVKIEIG